MSEQDALAAIRATFITLDGLGARFAVAEPPASGSALADDNATFPRLPLGELARQSLAIAWDHFTCIRLTIEAERSFVSATGSLTRGALVGSAQAYWLLHLDDPAERRERGLQLAEEWYRRRIQFQRELTPTLSSADQQVSRTQLTMLEQDLAAASAARTTSGALVVTKIIEDAAAVRFGDPTLTRNAVLEWRRLGGDAHAIGWQLMLQQVAWVPQMQGGPSAAAVRGSLANVAEPYLAAWHIFGAAIVRFDALSASSQGS